MTHETMTQTQQVSEKAEDLVDTYGHRAGHAGYCDGSVGQMTPQAISARTEAWNHRDALLSYIASLEADAKRLDWLEARREINALMIDADEGSEVQVFIGKGLWECYASLRDAADGKFIDAASTEESR